MPEAHLLLDTVVRHDPILSNEAKRPPSARCGDIKLAKILELSGAADLAQAAWISRVSDAGVVSLPVAQVGEMPLVKLERTIAAVNDIPGLFSEFHQPIVVPHQTDSIICPLGDRTAGRAALFFHGCPLSLSFRAQLDDAMERVRQLVHMVWVIRGEELAESQQINPAEELAEQCPFGMLILDADQNVHLANRPARNLLAKSSAVGLMGNRLIVNQSTDAIRFQVALRSVLMQPSGRPSDERRTKSLAVDGCGNQPLLVSISNLTGSHNAVPRACVIVTRPGAQTQPEITSLAEHFSLTPVEVRVARELVKGLSVQDIAQALQLKVQTVRSYLKQIFQKTGTHRQSELMQLMLNGALPVLD